MDLDLLFTFYKKFAGITKYFQFIVKSNTFHFNVFNLVKFDKPKILVLTIFNKRFQFGKLK